MVPEVSGLKEVLSAEHASVFETSPASRGIRRGGLRKAGGHEQSAEGVGIATSEDGGSRHNLLHFGAAVKDWKGVLDPLLKGRVAGVVCNGNGG